MKKLFSSKFWWVAALVIVVAINFIASAYHSRIDLTKEKRYTLSPATKRLLAELDDEVTIEVFFKGNYPAGFKKIVNSVEEFLQDLRDYSNGKIKIVFNDPLKELPESSADHFIDSIRHFYDISPYTLQAPSKPGDEIVVKQVLPGAVVHYQNKSVGVNLVGGLRSFGSEQEQLAEFYNNVEASLEFKFADAIQKATREKLAVAWLVGNGETFNPTIDDAFRTIRREYLSDTFNLKLAAYIPREIHALVVVKPTIPFTDEDKLKIDQYVMNGGRIFWMIDNMYAEFDSLYKSGGFIAYDRALNLEDILFRYGARLNQNLLQDLQCDKLPQVSNNQQRLVDWPFFPILNGTNHPISKNLDGVRAIFPNTLDTVRVEGIKKTFLLRSSANARILSAPAKIDFEFFQIAPDPKLFTVHDTTVAVLLEGKFKSLYAGRMPKSFLDTMAKYNQPVRTVCDADNKMIVVADGDIAINPVGQQYGPLPMGYNFYINYTFANKDFFTNSLEYLVNPSNILETRSKEYTLRLLDLKKVQEEKTTWQFINIALPILLVILFGFIYYQLRKRKFAAQPQP